MSLHPINLKIYGCNIWIEVPDKEQAREHGVASHYCRSVERELIHMVQRSGVDLYAMCDPIVHREYQPKEANPAEEGV